jgi:hypothetical protein
MSRYEGERRFQVIPSVNGLLFLLLSSRWASTFIVVRRDNGTRGGLFRVTAKFLYFD